MQKLIYWIGVYTVCNFIRDVGEALVKRGIEACDKRDKKNEIKGIRVREEHKPMNKIGFSIESSESASTS